jgi:carboxyl-terminal processing protease
MKKILLISLTLILGVLSIGFISSKDPFFQIKKNFTLFSEVINEVNDLYVVSIDPEKVIRSGINAMLDSLDPYTVLIDEADTQEIDFMTTGRYAGVGIEAGVRNGTLVVIAPIDGFSAARAGVRAGDVIVSVNGISSSELTAEDLNNNLRGEPGSKVTMVVKRLGMDDPIEFELVRERIEIKNVPFYAFADQENGIAYVILSRFSQNATEEIREAIRNLSNTAEVKGLILDLRNNPGGLLNEAVKTVDIFLPAGEEVVSTRGQHRQSRQSFKTEQPAMLATEPVIILQNQGSASSSEIVAGALQDHDRAVILGEQSFGKGLVQIIRPLSYSTALKITTSNYYIPSGRSIQSVNYGTSDDADDELVEFKTKNGRTVLESTGVMPDEELKDDPENMLELSLMRHNSYFFFANEYVSENEVFNQNGESLFREFQAWLKENDFTYETRSERLIGQLEEQLLAEAGDKRLFESQIANLRANMVKVREQEMTNSRDRIIRELKLELASRYNGTTGRQQLNLELDPLILRAKALMLDKEAYNRILQ